MKKFTLIILSYSFVIMAQDKVVVPLVRNEET